jgi:hypothetical protein
MACTTAATRGIHGEPKRLAVHGSTSGRPARPDQGQPRAQVATARVTQLTLTSEGSEMAVWMGQEALSEMAVWMGQEALSEMAVWMGQEALSEMAVWMRQEALSEMAVWMRQEALSEMAVWMGHTVAGDTGHGTERMRGEGDLKAAAGDISVGGWSEELTTTMPCRATLGMGRQTGHVG